MTVRRCSVVLVSLLLACNAAQAQQRATVNTLAWLAGCWEQRSEARVVQEQWMAPAGGMMIGASRTTVRGVARAWEFLRIVTQDSSVSYIAVPSGQRETSFAATLLSDTLAVFENPSHDFPQRIAYRRRGADSLVARVSGLTNGRERGFDVPMRRGATCGA